MAAERDFELLDDYLSNRMGEQERTAFEQKIKADPDLRNEYALQKQFIQGIKQARIAELKSMLNNVPVPASGTGNAIASKIVIGTVATLVIAVAAYWFTREDHDSIPPATVDTQQRAPIEKPVVPQSEPEEFVEEQKTSTQAPQQRVEDKNQTSAGTEHSKPSLAKRPGALAAPGAPGPRKSSGADSSSGNEAIVALKPVESAITVETDRTDTRYTSHYQFRNGKLMLFGNFETGSYRVMEFETGDKRRVFLSHSGEYYELLRGDDQVRALTPVRDAELISKLSESR